MRNRMIAGNWKMNKTYAEGVELAQGLADELKDGTGSVDVVIAPPTVDLKGVSEVIEQTTAPFALSAQNVYFEEKGAYTGETAPDMDNFLYPNFFSTAANNYSKWASTDFDSKIEEARQIVNDDDRRVAYREINQIVGDDMPPGRIEGGDVRYRGQSLLKMSELQMQDIRGNDIAMIFQDPMTSLNPVYTIGRQLGEGLRLHRGYTKEEALKRSIELLEMVGIPNPEQRVKDYPHQFSGGMRSCASGRTSCRPSRASLPCPCGSVAT